MVEIKPYDQARHQGQILGLFSDVGFKSEIWNYQFLENPGAQARGFNPVVAEDGGRVVGFNGVVPVSIRWKGESKAAMWSCDFKVDESYRGRGVGRLIKEELAVRSPILMSFGISPIATLVLERMGWCGCTDVHFLKRIRRPQSIRDLALMVYQSFSRLLHCGFETSNSEVLVRQSLASKDEIDRLWKEVLGDYDKTVERTWAYLNWRYQQHPFASYHFIELREKKGKLQAIGVVRVDQRQARLVDYLGPAANRPIKRTLIKTLLSHWNHLSAYSAMTSDPELKSVMKSLGFYQGREQPRFYVWASPKRFSDKGRDDSTVGWFIMGGDSDGELLQSARESWNQRNTDKEGDACRLTTP